MGGTTRTAEAMLYALREFYPKFGGREKAEVERYMIVFTDGHSQVYL
jgi:predicted metal-dependent peptidase